MKIKPFIKDFAMSVPLARARRGEVLTALITKLTGRGLLSGSILNALSVCEKRAL
jgi:hypothetical protein